MLYVENLKVLILNKNVGEISL